MTLVYTIDEDGNEYLYGRYVSFVPDWAVHDFPMDQAPVWDDGLDEWDEVYPTHHESVNKRIGLTARCNCEHCIAEGDQSHGSRARGPKQVPEWDGHRRVEYGLWPVYVGSFESWKKHRKYQARARV